VTEQVTVTFDGASSVTGAPCFLRVTLLNRPYAQNIDPQDHEVINSQVSVHADAFKGQYATAEVDLGSDELITCLSNGGRRKGEQFCEAGCSR